MIVGDEFAVELLTVPLHTAVWPVASLGALDGHCAPWKRVRVEPAGLPDGVQETLVAVVQDIVDTYRPSGPWQMDFAVSDGDLYVIELNGRFGGLSNMSWVSTGCDPHVAHVEAVLGRPLGQALPARVALELPVYNEAELPPAPVGLTLKSFVGTPTYRVPLIAGCHRSVLGVPVGCEEGARAWLLDLPAGLLLVDLDEAAAQLARGMRTLSHSDAWACWDALDLRRRGG